MVFWLFALLLLAGALWVVTLQNVFRAALSLGLVLVSVAGLFLCLEAEFLAFVQILVYVGAILTLVVFAIMLTARLQVSSPRPPTRPRLPAAVASIGLFIVLSATTRTLTWPSALPHESVSLAVLGQELVTKLVLPFELVSLVFVAALVGAIALAGRGAKPLG